MLFRKSVLSQEPSGDSSLAKQVHLDIVRYCPIRRSVTDWRCFDRCLGCQMRGVRVANFKQSCRGEGHPGALPVFHTLPLIQLGAFPKRWKRGRYAPAAVREGQWGRNARLFTLPSSLQLAGLRIVVEKRDAPAMVPWKEPGATREFSHRLLLCSSLAFGGWWKSGRRCSCSGPCGRTGCRPTSTRSSAPSARRTCGPSWSSATSTARARTLRYNEAPTLRY